MLITVDIGNTSVALGFYRNGKAGKTSRITSGRFSSRHYLKKLNVFLRQAKAVPGEIEGAIVVSVVPTALKSFRRALRRLGSFPILVVGENAAAPIPNRYQRPRQVGQDRLVTAVAGKRLYGAPLVIMDFGTAITCDAVSGRGEYLGGLIIPGVEISLQSLHRRTARLPLVGLRRPEGFIGRDTAESIINGIIFGFAGMVDLLAKKMKAKLGGKAKIVVTGGQARHVIPYCHEIDRVDQDLIMKGLKIIWDDYHSRKQKNAKTRNI